MNNGLSKDVHIVIPMTCDYITLYVKENLADVIKNLEMRAYPGFTGGVI